jgi:hypothetical protein
MNCRGSAAAPLARCAALALPPHTAMAVHECLTVRLQCRGSPPHRTVPYRTVAQCTALPPRHLHMQISHRMTSPAHGSIKAWRTTTPVAAFGLRDQVCTWNPPHSRARARAEPAGRCDAEGMAILKARLSGME